MGFIEKLLDVEVLTLILTTLGGIFALYQWNISVRNNKAQYVDELLQRMMDDKKIREFLRIVDYEEEWYLKEFHDVAENKSFRHIPQIADRTLFFVNHLCYLNNRRIIRRSELRVFEYYLITLAQSPQIQSYILDLYHYSLAEKRMFPFGYFLDYAVKNKIIPKEVKDPDYMKYVMMLEGGARNLVPHVYTEIYNTIGKRSFLHTCSKCAHCKHFNGNICDKEQETEQFYWMLSFNRCEHFTFDHD